MGQKWTRVLLFSGKPLDTNMVLCCTEKLCGGTDTAPQGAHPLYRRSTASKRKIYQSEKRKVIRQTTDWELASQGTESVRAALGSIAAIAVLSLVAEVMSLTTKHHGGREPHRSETTALSTQNMGRAKCSDSTCSVSLRGS